ncbi:MAG: undecaprenyl-diphosphate phosphatase [Clostridia bacterium]|nr:undecaprenyl-diphosphate phosphatase [Clostridia bacterium]
MYIINILKSILFGIVEGITEWLPISSTGHMILLEKICQFKEVSPEFFEMFLVVIQLGAIMAVIVMFWNKLWPFKRVAVSDNKKTVKVRMASLNLWFKVIVGSIPAGVLGLIFDDLLDKYLYNHITVAITLVVYGILFIVIEFVNKKRKPRVRKLSELTYKDAFLIGLFQALSLIPGTSRSGSTILGGISIGTSRTVASEFTFFLAVPAMLGASALKLLKFGFHFSVMEFVILINGMIVAFAVSLLCIRFLMNFIKKHNFNIFGIYRIILGAIVLAAYFLGR